MKPTIITPDPKNVTDDNFVRWYDQKTFGSEVGSLGMKKGQPFDCPLNVQNV